MTLICRVVGVSESWLLGYIKEVYTQLPDDLNAQEQLPDLENYLANRMEEEISRLRSIKKSNALERYTQVDQEGTLNQTAETEPFWERLTQGSLADVWLEEVYGQECGGRVSWFALQLDERWSFVQKKENKCWVWLALNPANRQIVAFHVGGRSPEDAQKREENIPGVFKQTPGFFSDYWQAYQAVLDPGRWVKIVD